MTLLRISYVIFLFCIVKVVKPTLFGYENPSENLVKNWDCESDPSNNDWVVSQSTVQKVSGGYTGASSFKISRRSNIDGGVSQTISGMTANRNYYFSAFVKLLTNNPINNGWSKLTAACSVDGVTIILGRLPFLRAEENIWKQIGGDFLYTGGAVKCWIRAEPLDVDFQMDTVSLVVIQPYSNWKAHFDNEIKNVRTNPLRISGNLPAGCSPGGTNIKVELTRHEFGFGTAISGGNFLGTSTAETKYRDIVIDNFNWAVFENDQKWKATEKTKGSINFGVTDSVIDYLKARNFTMRGHTLLWDLMESTPEWLRLESGNVMKETVINRVEYMLEHYGNDIDEWDVCNEYGHNHFIEEFSNDRDMIVEEFQKAYSINPRPRYFLNDFDIVKNGLLTSYIADLGQYLLTKNVHVGGIGIQSHLRDLPIAPEVLEKRLEIASRLNLDVTITELSAHSTNVLVRRDGLDQAMRIYFANPKVKAVVLWDFSDQFGNFATDFFLVEGTNFTPNAAGTAFFNLLNSEWKTNETFSATSSSVDKTIPNAFRGNYKLQVICGGQVKAEKNFYVGKGTNTVII